ncbi:GON-4-like protein isoform X2 [Cryptotermes secundus]|uniref:GON-4-like protein isoform X2 n=1 Tax=Cryptotermes secundus TaxID=105785 RepID=UPI000CD7B951|nr:GON-4-like protein isoform X2 [Cryptotermes secundus]
MVCVNINDNMDNNSVSGKRRSVDDCPIWKNKPDTSCPLKLEVYEDHSSDGVSSEALEIVTSENEMTELSGRSPKRKRKDTSFYDGIPEILDTMDEEIERQLDSKVEKSNLTVANVKNILKHVISNKHFLAMVRRTIKDEGDGIRCDKETEDEFPYEPKLTRAKTKELRMTQPAISWPISPSKKPSSSKCQVLIEQELSEDSSDEEYQPNDEEQEQSDEEKETNSLATSQDMPPPAPTNLSASESASNSDCSMPISWSQDGLFKIPQESIGQRTRSKLSLSDTPLETIEKAFVPPDITTDMYDSECDDENWKDFLTNFTEPLTDVNDTIDDYEADPEYNFLEDEEETDDREELRADRAVKVSKKELNELVAALFEYTDMMSSDDEDPRTHQQETLLIFQEDQPGQKEDPAPVIPKLVVVSDNSAQEENVTVVMPSEQRLGRVMMSSEQRLLLDQQMRKHVQLTTQHFLQTYAHPQLSSCASECKGILVSLKFLGGANANSAFNAANLPAALNLIETWERRLSSSSPEASEIIGFVQKEIDMAMSLRRKKRVYNCQFPLQFLELVSQSEVFLYPLLLPAQPFRCDGFSKLFYFPSEDSLIAIGLEQFEQYLASKKSKSKSSSSLSLSMSKRKTRGLLIEVMNLISTFMMPCKDPRFLYFHVKKSRLVQSNPIQYYFQHNRAPKTDHYVIPFTPDLLRPPRSQPKELLPLVWREYLYPKKAKSQEIETSLLLLQS